jgi:hypothetical protein
MSDGRCADESVALVLVNAWMNICCNDTYTIPCFGVIEENIKDFEHSLASWRETWCVNWHYQNDNIDPSPDCCKWSITERMFLSSTFGPSGSSIPGVSVNFQTNE